MNEYTFNEISVGLTASFDRKITAEMEEMFRNITGDENPLHKDDAYACEVGQKSHVTFGMLTASLCSTLAGMYLPGKYSLIHSLENLSFRSPVYVGDTLSVSGEVVDKEENLHLLMIAVTIKNQYNKCVFRAKMKVLVLK